MIVPREAQFAAAVADHYDQLDRVYREIWGEHVHHGLWTRGSETPDEAVDALADLVGDRLGLETGQQVVDIGCGYGATARRFAARFGVSVTGLTISARQATHARPMHGVTILHRDWLANGLPDAGFDRAYAIESSEHMADKAGFFAEAWRVLRPGGRLAVCAWLARTGAGRWEVDHLLEPICREGRLPSMGTQEDYLALARAAGFRTARFDDISRQVRRTWTICLGRFARKLGTDRRYRELVRSPATRNRVFALSLPRLILAYRTGSMRYGVFVFEKGEQRS